MTRRAVSAGDGAFFVRTLAEKIVPEIVQRARLLFFAKSAPQLPALEHCLDELLSVNQRRG